MTYRAKQKARQKGINDRLYNMDYIKSIKDKCYARDKEQISKDYFRMREELVLLNDVEWVYNTIKRIR